MILNYRKNRVLLKQLPAKAGLVQQIIQLIFFYTYLQYFSTLAAPLFNYLKQARDLNPNPYTSLSICFHRKNKDN
jgi:hypothetical protein